MKKEALTGINRKIIKKLFVFLMLINFGLVFSQDSDKPYVVLVSLDGFRWDYPKYFVTPNLNAIAKVGVHAKSMKPSYPTKTFPNHYSIVTGLYPDHHGIINNSFYDPLLQKKFSLSSAAKNDAQFYGGNPIWNVAEQQGLKTASFFWPGSETGDKSPSIYKKYDETVPYANRINSVIDWLNLPEIERPHLITLYFDEPDNTGHTFGPMSVENGKIVAKMDSIIGVLVRKLDALPIGNKINLIVVSDHGMANISDSKKVTLLEYLKPNWVGYHQVINPIMSIQAKEGYKDSIAHALKKVPHIKFWATKDLPKRFHYGSNPRVLDFVIEAQKNYSLVSSINQKTVGGTHGYDNCNKDMHAIFYAKGPNFKKDKKTGTFQNVSIYPLIAAILGLQIEKVDGSLQEVKSLLRNK
ncbi:ectonucleotide pyrophosphatase/phosphodiesterase [uncultured Flavobacterium sp.]|jgi:predicted AlkP superfamily pyrophosphatase or phosphodiesterase|uniref:alkaline phosphatase family protein n=1 Tax=uncultured Flavobacterium sp. TaxID=165435 RepID=UPI0030CA45CD